MTPIGDYTRASRERQLPEGVHRRGKKYRLRYSGPKRVEYVDADGVRRIVIRNRPISETVAAKTPAEAAKIRAERLRQIANHRAGGERFQGPAQEKVTLEEVLTLLERDYAVHGRKSLPQLRSHLKPIRAFFSFERPAQRARRPPNHRMLAAHRDETRTFFASDRAVAVTPARLQEYILYRQQEQAAAATINRELEALQRAFRLAVILGKLSSAPKVPSLREDNARQGFFERAEFDSVLANLGDSDVRDFCEWMYWTGMRPGEIRALGWDGLDRETWTLRLHAKDAKTGHGRALALVGPYRTIIERRLKARRLDCPFIFHRAGQPMGEFRKRWKTACQAAGVKGRLVYDLRRTAVRNMIRAAVDPSVAMKISGHRTRSMLDRYNIIDDRDLRDAVVKTAAHIEKQSATRTIVPLRAVSPTKPNQEATQ